MPKQPTRLAVPKRKDAPGLRVVGIAASAGGLNAIRQVLSGLPADFPAPVVIVQHVDPRHKSYLAEILSRKTELIVKAADELDRLVPGVVYVSRPDRHLLVNTDGTVSLSRSELVHFLRPSGDLLFESLAASYGKNAISVVLSGTGLDGSMGVRAIKARGGTVIAQDPESAEFPGMPEAAIETGTVDRILPLDEIARELRSLVRRGRVRTRRARSV